MAQYDVIVLDETQDFNPCQYDAFVYQEPRCVRYLLGDEFQRIYGFRGARRRPGLVSAKVPFWQR